MRACVCVLLLFQLLTVNPEHRFSSLSDMQTSPYLADISWDAVYQKQMEAGFVPNVSLNMLHATHTRHRLFFTNAAVSKFSILTTNPTILPAV